MGSVIEVKCGACGSDVPTDSRYCPSCGQPMRALLDERRVVTVLFADLVGFTTLSETLDPEAVRRLVDAAFERLVADVTAFGGRVDKIVGDAIVALFGAPVAHEDDAGRAIRAGLAMHRSLERYADESGMAVRLRVGVNTGEVLVGALRVGGDYTAMGDVVNTAARLQTSAEPGEVLVGEATYAATADDFEFESRGAMLPRGREHAVNVWVARRALHMPGHRHGSTRSQLLGRDAEVSMLLATAESSLERGRGLVALILGEAGVGKTRLADEFCERLVDRYDDVTMLSGRCLPYGESNPWWPIAECLRSGVGLADDVPLDEARVAVTESVRSVVADDGEVVRIVNGLLHVLGFEGPLRGLLPAAARTEATDSLRSFMEASVRDHPILIRLADLHWADPIVLELIDSLAEHLARSRFVVIASARQSLMGLWSPRGARHNLLVVNLDPLARHSAEALLSSLAPDATAEVRAELLDRSGGNPLFLEELVSLLDTGVDRAELPDTLRGLIAARIDGLTRDEQLTLEDAAVWGSSGTVGALEKLAQHTHGGTDVGAMVAALAGKEVLEVTGRAWAFRSDLVREVAYQRLTKLDRLLRHAGIAAYLEAAFGSRFVDDASVDAIARHYLEAARLFNELGPVSGIDGSIVERAHAWIAEAIRRAEQSAAWVAVARLCTHGLDLHGPEGTERLGLLLTRAVARYELWDFVDARVDATAALDLASEVGDSDAQARSHQVLGEIASREGFHDESARHLERAVAGFDAAGDERGRAEALRRSGMALLFGGDPTSAGRRISEALDQFRIVDDRRGIAWSLQNLAWIAFTTGDPGAAERHLDEATTAFDEIGDAAGRAWTDGLMAFVRFHQGRLEEARALTHHVMGQSQRREDRWGEAMMLQLCSAMDLWAGNTSNALREARRAVEILTTLGDFGGLEMTNVVIGRSMVMLGDVADGLAVLAEARLAHDRVAIGAAGELSALGQLGQRFAPEVIERARIELDAAGPTARFGELWAAVALGLLFEADAPAADLVLTRGLDRDADPGRPARLAVDALVGACNGQLDRAERDLQSILSDPRGTYLDRLYARLAVGVAGDRSDLLEEAQRDVQTTEDLVARAIVASALESVLSSDNGAAVGPDPKRCWDLLGVDPVGWSTVIAALRSVTAQAAR